MGISNFEEQNVGADYTVEPTQQVVTPTTTVVNVTEQIIEHTDVIVSPDETSIALTPSGFIFPFSNPAYAVTSTQSEITITQWNTGLNGPTTFDSAGNFYKTDFNMVGHVDTSTNTLTTWTLPAGELTGSNTIGADSSGNVYFGQSNDKLGRLNTNTDVFTEWDISSNARFVSVDSLGNVFFSSSGSNVFVNKLEPSTNTITTWTDPGSSEVVHGNNEIIIDSSGNVYFSGSKFIFKLDTSTNIFTEWPLTDPSLSFNGLAVDSSGNIFFVERNIFDDRIARLVPATNTITEWTIPVVGSVGEVADVTTTQIEVDSTGNVFFSGDGISSSSDFSRLVPSTNIFTVWNSVPHINNFLAADSLGTIRFGISGGAGTIT